MILNKPNPLRRNRMKIKKHLATTFLLLIYMVLPAVLLSHSSLLQADTSTDEDICLQVILTTSRNKNMEKSNVSITHITKGYSITPSEYLNFHWVKLNENTKMPWGYNLNLTTRRSVKVEFNTYLTCYNYLYTSEEGGIVKSNEQCLVFLDNSKDGTFALLASKRRYSSETHREIQQGDTQYPTVVTTEVKADLLDSDVRNKWLEEVTKNQRVSFTEDKDFSIARAIDEERKKAEQVRLSNERLDAEIDAEKKKYGITTDPK